MSTGPATELRLSIVVAMETLLQDGRCAGTMALTEPGQGSALGDLTTQAIPHADGSYRLFGMPATKPNSSNAKIRFGVLWPHTQSSGKGLEGPVVIAYLH